MFKPKERRSLFSPAQFQLGMSAISFMLVWVFILMTDLHASIQGVTEVMPRWNSDSVIVARVAEKQVLTIELKGSLLLLENKQADWVTTEAAIMSWLWNYQYADLSGVRYIRLATTRDTPFGYYLRTKDMIKRCYRRLGDHIVKQHFKSVLADLDNKTQRLVRQSIRVIFVEDQFLRTNDDIEVRSIIVAP